MVSLQVCDKFPISTFLPCGTKFLRDLISAIFADFFASCKRVAAKIHTTEVEYNTERKENSNNRSIDRSIDRETHQYESSYRRPTKSRLTQINNQSLIPSTDVIQLTLTLKMTTAQVVETSTTVLFRTTFTRTIMLNLLMKNKSVVIPVERDSHK